MSRTQNPQQKPNQYFYRARLEVTIPQSLEAEQGALGACLMDAGALEIVEQMGIVPDHFYRQNHRAIWRSMTNLKRRGFPVDLITVVEHLRKWGRLEEAQGAAYLTSLIEACPSSANAAAYAEIVMEASRMRSFATLGERLLKAACDPEAESFRIAHEFSQALKCVMENGVLLDVVRESRTAVTEGQRPGKPLPQMHP